MSSDNSVVRVENLSKVYNIGAIRSMWSKIPFLNNRHVSKNPLIWALKDIGFECKKGETLGIIGPNGAGKSTLLKILCGVTKPTSGSFQMRGQVAPLIEIGAGFHPEMTGRENIYLNGAIMGMAKKEIGQKFDQIVDFSGLQGFIDTPIKKYSSGMKVRLGFSIAVHIDPDVLLVDEVLAVGDVGFRAKCYNRISKLNKRCAVVVVSHNMSAIARISSKCILLNKGNILFYGAPEEAVQRYLSMFKKTETNIHCDGVRLVACDIKADSDSGSYLVHTGGPLDVTFDLDSDIDGEQINLILAFFSSSGEFVAEWNSWFTEQNLRLYRGRQIFNISLHELRLNPGIYNASLIITSGDKMHHLLWVDNGWSFRVEGGQFGNAPYEISGSISGTRL